MQEAENRFLKCKPGRPMRKPKTFLKILLFLIFISSFIQPALAQVPAPSLQLKDAVTIAESALAKANIDMSKYYIYSVVYTNSSGGQFWFFTYKTIKPSVSQEIHVNVYMNGKTEFSGSFFLRSGY